VFLNVVGMKQTITIFLLATLIKEKMMKYNIKNSLLQCLTVLCLSMVLNTGYANLACCDGNTNNKCSQAQKDQCEKNLGDAIRHYWPIN
jgi:hypothetical protein